MQNLEVPATHMSLLQVPEKTESSKSKGVSQTSGVATRLAPVLGPSILNHTAGSLLKKEVPHAPIKGGSKVYLLGTSTTALSLLPRESRDRASKHWAT